LTLAKPGKMTRILIVDNDEMVRSALSDYLNALAEFEVVGTASNGQEAVKQASLLEPDVIIMEMVMPIMDGIEATQRIHEAIPWAAIILLSDFGNIDSVRNGLSAGASIVISKGNPMTELIQAIHAAWDSREYFPYGKI
jgi:DNA-binding NarL/FixJ family response regulator